MWAYHQLMDLYYVHVLFILSPEKNYIMQCFSLHSCTDNQANAGDPGLYVLLFMLPAKKRGYIHLLTATVLCILLQKCKISVVTPGSI